MPRPPETSNLTAPDRQPPTPEDTALSSALNTLPGWAARGLVYLLIALVGAALLWAAFGRVDVVVSAPATVVPRGQLRIAQTSVGGVVHRVEVVDGDSVAAGQALIVLRSEKVGSVLLDVERERQKRDLAAERLETTVPRKVEHLEGKIASEETQFEQRKQAHEQALAKLDERETRYEQQIESVQRRLDLIETQLRINRRLEKQGLAARNRVLQVEQAQAEAETQLKELQSLAREVKLDRRIENSEFQSERERHRQAVAEIEQRIVDLREEARLEHERAQLAYEDAVRRRELVRGADTGEGDGEGDLQTTVVRAPASGRIAELSVRNPGQTLEPGATVATIVPSDAELMMELRVPDDRMGRVRADQDVKFKFDAFPYQEYGVIRGTLRRIPPSATTEPDGRGAYRVLAGLDHTGFTVEGDERPLLPGMHATAEIVAGEKTVLQRLLEPLAPLTRSE